MTTTRNHRDLYAPGHAPQPFEPGVFDDALDAYPPYHRYEGPVTPEAAAAAQKKAAELGLLPAGPTRRAGTVRAIRPVPATTSYRPPRSGRSSAIAAHSRDTGGGKSSGTRARSAITGRFVKKATAERHPKTTVVEKTKKT